jgi:hypothetical protein
MRQHDHRRRVCLDRLDGFIFLHISDSIDHRIDLSTEGTAMLQDSFIGAQFDLPSGIEIFSTREHNIRMVLDENTGQMPEGYQSGVNKWRVEGHGRGQKYGHLSETDAVVPDVECAFTFGFAENAIRGAGEVMRHLEDIGNPFWDGNGKNK